MRTARAVCAAGLLGAATFSAAAPPPDTGRPPYAPLRFEEDWSAFDPADGDDFWDPLKHVDLTEDGRIWVSFGGEFRGRVEAWQDFGFVDGEDDVFALGRARLHADLHLGEHVRVFLEGLSAHVTDRNLPGGRRTLDVDTLEPHDAFVDLMLPWGDDGEVTLRVGRQELLFGRQRLVSPLPWANAMRAWDAVRVLVERGEWRVDGFASLFVPVQKYEFNDWAPGSNFYGVYASGSVAPGDRPFEVDLYVLGLSRDDVHLAGELGDEDRISVGARIGGDLAAGLDFDVEGTYQFGELGSADLSAWSFASVVGRTFGDVRWSPRVEVGFDYASGDGAPGDGDVGTFYALFPLGHAYFGILDVIGRQNVVDLSSSVSISPLPRLKLKLAAHCFWRARDDDAVYNPGGVAIRPGGLSDRSEVGQEIDLTATYALSRHWTLEGGYAHFFPGDFLRDSGPHDDIDWGYLQAVYRF